MRGRLMILLALLILLGPFSSWGQEKERVLPLTLEDTILRTLKNNYGVAIQILSPELSSLAVVQAKEKFLPSLGFGFSDRSNQSAAYSWLDAAAETTITDYYDYDAQVQQLIPTGGTLTASLTSYRNKSNSRLQTVNPRYGSTLRFDFRQPLLRDFGLKMTRRDIIISQNNYDISETDLEKTIADVINTVEQAYWNLIYSIENLKVRQQSLKLAQDLLAKNQRAVEVGTMAPIEIVTAQAEVATREAEILSAEAQVKNNEDRLRTIINLPEAEMKLALPIRPLDMPKFEERKIDVDEALRLAMENRPELKSLRLGLENQDLNISYAKNQLLPRLDFSVSYYSPGVSGDRLIYRPDDPLGDPIAIIPGGSSGALKDALSFKYKNWAVGLTLDFSLSSIFSRAAYAQARVQMEQSLLQIKNQEQIIYLEIRNGVREVETNYKTVQAYRVARELAERKLQATEEKLKVGLSTNFEVLTYQRDLSNARISELQSIVNYSISMANLEKAMGTNLKNRSISVDQVMAGR
ncbi:MAG: TolC family protein [Acidobacteriota bacterium]